MCDGRQFRRYRRGTDVRGMDWLSNPDCEFARTVQRSFYQMRGSIEQYIPQIWIEWRRLGFQLPHTLAAKGNDLGFRWATTALVIRSRAWGVMWANG